MHEVIKQTLARFEQGKRTRILGFGSSNTDHFLTGMHWFECIDLALCQKYGRLHTSINSGIGGDTSNGLLERFVDDAEFYQPHLAFITIGGNDSNPDRNIPAEKFESNLRQLYEKFTKMGCKVIYQTYYAPDPDQLEDLKPFYQYSDIVRQVAEDTGAYLIDHLARWEPFRLKYNAEYKKLMQDGFHVNRFGNMVMGVDIARHFMLPLGTTGDPYWDEDFWGGTLKIQTMMDEAQK